MLPESAILYEDFESSHKPLFKIVIPIITSSHPGSLIWIYTMSVSININANVSDLVG